MTEPVRNRLADAASPYLRQHASNPVDWYPWGTEALERARVEDRPILLSIGYSACHWCHVMARESFSDPATAERMNRDFINIKVDREERPDLDRIHQAAHQLLTRQPGGWPLTVFLDPQDLTPFFAGTYFPPRPGFGRPGFPGLLERIREIFDRQRGAIREQGGSLREALDRLARPEAGTGEPGLAPVTGAGKRLAEVLDEAHGGLRGAPKFPPAHALDFLLGGDADDLETAATHLRRIGRSGLFDHVGGGFFRYCVDARWEIPHFEKMLSDNALLLPLYAEAAARTGDAELAGIAAATADWALGEMRTADGGFATSLDAESGGEEGGFYTWTRDELDAALEGRGRSLWLRAYGLDRPANFAGRWHLRRRVDTATLADAFDLAPGAVEAQLQGARERLAAHRARRPRPGRDDKRLTSWNALMIRGLARAGRLLGRPEWLEAAGRAVDALRTTAWRDGRLMATDAGLPGYLDDHVFLLDALLECLQGRWRGADLDWARALAEAMRVHFRGEDGAFRLTADDHERLIQRPCPVADEAVPAGNAVAVRALARLGWLLGEPALVGAAGDTLRAVQGDLDRDPLGHLGLLAAQREWLEPPTQSIVRADAETLAGLRQEPLPATARAPAYPVPAGVDDLPAALAAKAAGDTPRAYPCRGSECAPPIEGGAAVRTWLTRGTL